MVMVMTPCVTSFTGLFLFYLYYFNIFTHQSKKTGFGLSMKAKLKSKLKKKMKKRRAM